MRIRILAGIVTALGFLPASASAHAVVYPKVSKQGGYEKYVLRVPNEKDVATTRVEIRFPADMRITSFTDVPGWQLEIQRDSAKRIIGAVWTGNLPPERFVEFPFVAANPKKDVVISWPAFQTYASGERVDWVGPEGSKHPASVTTIGSETGGNPKFQLYGTIAALLMSFIALGLALRRAP
jgi:hypothetical protein